MSQRQQAVLSVLLIVLQLIGLSGCLLQPLSQSVPLSKPEEMPAKAPVGSTLDTAPPNLDPAHLIKTNTPYRLTTIDFANAEGYLTTTRSGAGLMQIRRPRYPSEQTFWIFTPAADGSYYLHSEGQTDDWAYSQALVAVKSAEDDAQRWQISLLDNGYYRLTNQALGEGQSLAAVGQGIPYPGWGEVNFAATADVDSQYWILEEVVEPVVADADADEDEPPVRGAIASEDTVIPFENFGVWQRGEQPYGEFSQSQEQAVTGSSGKLHYDFSQASNADDFVLFSQQSGVDGEPGAIHVQVYGDRSGHFLSAWILDGAGETWSIGLGPIAGNGWQSITGRIDPNAGWPTGHIAGPENGQIDYPIQLAGLVLDRLDINASAIGDIYLDDLTFTVGLAATATEAPVSASATISDTVQPATEEVAAAPTETATPAAEISVSTTSSSSDNSYELIPLEDTRDNRPAAEHADLNLRLREFQPIDEVLGFIETDGATDESAPNLLGVLEPNFVGTYTAYDWDWQCNCKGNLIEYPWGRVAAVAFATTPGEAIYIPRRQFSIFQGKFYAVLLYATENSVAFVYTREGNIANGYAVYYQGLVTDPNLLKLYRESSGNMLPGLTLDTPVGTATDTLLVTIRDRGAFMDPRNHENWWLDRGLPHPPGR